MFAFGHTELLVIGLIVFILFGAKRLPDIGKGLGGAIREFRQVKKELKSDQPADTPAPAAKEEAVEAPASLESQVMGKVIEQVPGVKTAVTMKKKVDQVSSLLK